MEQIENRMVVDSEWKSPYTVSHVCSCCEGAIYEDECYYEIEDDIVCTNCIDDYVKENFRRTG
ncbi:MAG: hypothetical protein UFG06_13845 [Lachnospiraceae bacterium]|nr:hypothetical protein [Lachnospiraceae bacterium]